SQSVTGVSNLRALIIELRKLTSIGIDSPTDLLEIANQRLGARRYRESANSLSVLNLGVNARDALQDFRVARRDVAMSIIDVRMIPEKLTHELPVNFVCRTF